MPLCSWPRFSFGYKRARQRSPPYLVLDRGHRSGDGWHHDPGETRLGPYGFALFEITQWIVTPALLLRDSSVPILQIRVLVVSGLVFGALFFLAGRALSARPVPHVDRRVHGKIASNNRAAASITSPQPQKSIAVLPFLDLTKGMKEKEFADGMTEEFIDKLSKIPGLRVPSPTSSFYFKGKRMPVGEIAKTLGVSYVLDGSVRKSGARVRIAARLIRSDNVYVVWSETYDRPFDDRLNIQDDIASEVTQALTASIDSKRDAR